MYNPDNIYRSTVSNQISLEASWDPESPPENGDLVVVFVNELCAPPEGFAEVASSLPDSVSAFYATYPCPIPVLRFNEQGEYEAQTVVITPDEYERLNLTHLIDAQS